MSEKANVLTDVTIEGLRGVGRVELRLDPKGARYPADSGRPGRGTVYTFFGANGVGKTKCLEALYQFLLLSNRNFVQELKTVSDVGSDCFVMSRITDDLNGMSFAVPGGKVENFVARTWEEKNVARLHDLPVVFLGAGRRTSLNDAGSLPISSSLGTFADRRKQYFRSLLLSFDSCDLSNLGMTGDTRAWFVTRAQSTNRFQKSNDNRLVEIETLLSILNIIDSRIDGSLEGLVIDGNNRVFLKVEGEERELGELSSGFISLVKLIQAIVDGYAAFTNEKQLQNVRGIVLIDEIDAHLHVEWQARIVPCLKKLFPNTTFYIATHSPLVLVQLLKGEAYLLKRGDDGVVRSEMINYPNRRLFDDVLNDALGVNLNRLKIESMENDDQSEAKQRLRELLEKTKRAKA